MAEPAPSVFRPGGISYVEIACRDTNRAADFYEGVFGWSLRRDSDEPAFTDGSGHVIGHFVARAVDTREGGIRPYVYVEGVDETLQAVIENGGEVAMPPRPEGTLRVATFRDPEGNVVGVWTETATSSRE